MAPDNLQQDNNAGAWDDQLVELENTGELDGDGVAVYRPRRDGGDRTGAGGALVHRTVKRPLLPYQKALCETLGISEDDYHEFLAVQRDWRPSEEELLQELRGDPISIVLTVVGILFQVVGMLLAPKPETPKNRPQTRQQRFAPRYSFNSTQELARYGDPIQLVYCNRSQNRLGVVRVSGALLWSAVESTGSAQFMQLLLLIGAARVKGIDFEKTAFGQLPLGQISKANTWVYYDEIGSPVRFENKVIGDGQDPAREGLDKGDIVHQIKDGNNWHTGYSQAHTPSGSTTFGCYSPIPINVKLGERRQSGRLRWANNGIVIAAGGWDTKGDGRWHPGDKIRLLFKKAVEKKDNLAQEAAKDMRYQMVSFLDLGSTYQLGSAKFKVNFISDNLNLDKGDVYAQLECVEKGRKPSTPYDEEKANRYNEEDLEKIENAYDILRSPASETRGAIDKTQAQPLGLGVPGNRPVRQEYQPWKLRRATSYEQSDEEQYEGIQNFDVAFSFRDVKYSFKGFETIKWKDDLDQEQAFTFYKGGSLKYTKRVLRDFLADKPKLKTAKLRQEYDDDLERARELRDKASSGGYNKKFRNEAKSEEIAKEIRQEIEYRLERRRWSEGAKENNNDTIKDLEQKIEDEKDRNKPDKSKIKVWRDEIRELRRQREFGDTNEKKNSDTRIQDLRDARGDFLDGRIGEKQEAYVLFIRNAQAPFTGLDGNRYACGIKCLKRKLNGLKGEWTTDQWGVYKVTSRLKELIKEKEDALRYARWIVKNWETLIADVDDSFFTKCLVKVDTARYQTVTDCDYVKLNIRARLFRRISGRAKVYGQKDAPDGYRYSDNGVKGRMAFFSIRFRWVGGDWQRVPYIFTMRRAADTDNFITLKFESKRSKRKWEYELSPLLDPAAEVKEHGYKGYLLLENGGKRSRVAVGQDTFAFHGSIEAVDWNGLPKMAERGPIYTNEWDFFSPRSDSELQASFDQRPEFALVNVTEQQKCDISGKYQNMSLLAVHTFSGAGVQELRNLTAYVTEGKACWKVGFDGSRSQDGHSTSYAPDIFADTVLDQDNGIGKFANANGVDWGALGRAKRFCINNGLGCQMFMDGVIADRVAWREFWVETAPYSLLEFARINGRETLVPALPVDGTGKATRQLEISALFNQGNILEGSYKEEFLDYGDNTRDLIATVIYRNTVDDEMFPRNDSVTVALKDTLESDAVRQTFDLSDWVTQRRQAELYGRFLCQQRRHLKRGIEFRTVPSDNFVGPGAYIFVDAGIHTWDAIRTGVIEEGGKLNTPLAAPVANGSYKVLTYKSGQEPATHTVNVTNGTAPALADRVGHLFTMGVQRASKRVYRVSEVRMEESGEVTVKATEHPTDDQLRSLAADLSDSLFRIVGVGC